MLTVLQGPLENCLCFFNLKVLCGVSQIHYSVPLFVLWVVVFTVWYAFAFILLGLVNNYSSFNTKFWHHICSKHLLRFLKGLGVPPCGQSALLPYICIFGMMTKTVCFAQLTISETDMLTVHWAVREISMIEKFLGPHGSSGEGQYLWLPFTKIHREWHKLPKTDSPFHILSFKPH